jgi:hypothetical protein
MAISPVNLIRFQMSTFKKAVSPSSAKPAAKAAPAKSRQAPAPVELLGTLAYPCFQEVDEQSGKYSCLLAIEKDSDSAQDLFDLVGDAAEYQFGERELDDSQHNPLRSSDEKNRAGEYTFKHPFFRTGDFWVVRLKTGFAPSIVWGPNETPTTADQVNGGDLVIIETGAYGYANQSSGVALSLGRVHLISKGDHKIERGTGSSNVRRIDRSGLRFTNTTSDEA